MRLNSMMFEQSHLSRNERYVLYHLVRSPMLFDKEICSMIPMKLSTFSNIKKRLSEMGCYKTVRIPSFGAVGCEFLVIFYGLLDNNTTLEQRLKVARTMLEECREFFYIISESNQGINIAACKNYTEYEKDVQKFNQIYKRYGFLAASGYQNIIFPLEISSIYNFFSYSGVLNRYFDLGIREDRSHNTIVDSSLFSIKKKGLYKLTNIEKNVYLGLIKYPDLPDIVLSKRISISKNTVIKAKKKIFDNGLIIKKVIPNLGFLGFKLLAFIDIKFNPDITMSNIDKYIPKLDSLLTPVFLVYKNLEGAVMAPFWSFEDYQVRYSNALKFLFRKKLIKDPPINYLLSIPQITTIKDHIYEPLASKILEIG